MTNDPSMFGDVPSDKIQENVRQVLRAKPNATLEDVYREMLVLYGINELLWNPEWQIMWKFICDVPTIQRRVRDFQNGSLQL